MAVLKVLHEPDPRLRQISEDVSHVTEDIIKFLNDMADTMYAEDGIGLAAPQVDCLKRLVVMHVPSEAVSDSTGRLWKFINPKIVWQSEEKVVFEEGCLSVPGMAAPVTRSREVRLQFLDEAGAETEHVFKGLEAVCCQHELDHLNGILFIDYLSQLKRSFLRKKIKK